MAKSKQIDLMQLAVSDDGFQYNKTATWSAPGKIKISVEQTNVAGGIRPDTKMLISSEDSLPEVFLVDGVAHTVSESIPSRDAINPRDKSFNLHAASVSVMARTLLRSGISGDVHLLTTMPIDDYFSKRGQDLVKQKSEMLVKAKIEILDPSDNSKELVPFKIVSADVKPEAMGAYYDWLLSDDLEVRKERCDVIVLDFGGETADAVFVDDKSNYAQDSVQTYRNSGMKAIMEEVVAATASEISYWDTFSTVQKEEIIRNRQLKKRNLTKEVDAAVQNLVDKVVSGLTTYRSDILDRADNIILVGGTGQLVADTIKGLKYDWASKVEVLPNAQSANARGILKFRTYQLAQNQELTGWD